MNIGDVNKENEVKVDSEEQLTAAEAKYKRDMFRYKDRLTEVERELEAEKARKDAEERESLEKSKKFEELYKREASKAQEIQAKYEADRKRLERERKLTAIKAQVQFEKDEFAEKFVDLDLITVDETGAIDPYSVKMAADRVRSDYPMLLKQGGKMAPTSSAPRSTVNPLGTQDEMTMEKYMSLNESERKLKLGQYVKGKNYVKVKWSS